VVQTTSGQVDSRDKPYSEMLHVGPENITEGSGQLVGCQTAGELNLISGKYLFTPDDVLYSKIRPYLRKIALPDFTGVCSADMYPLRPRSGELVREYLFAWLLSARFTAQAVSFQNRTGIPKINRQQLDSTSIALPPPQEQRAIAQVLRTVQRAKEAAEAVVAAARQLKRSLLRHLFTYGPVPVEQADRVPLKETEVGPIPEHWHLTTLSEVIAKGPQNGLYRPKTDYGSGTPIVRIDDFDNSGSIVEAVPNLVRLTDAEVSTYGLAAEDLLVNRVNSLSHLGKTGLVGQLSVPTVFESNMMRFGVDVGRARPRFVFHLLNLPAVRDVMRSKAKRAVAQSSINQEDVKSLPLPLPPLADQDEITRMLSVAEAKLAAEAAKVAALDALFKTLLRDLMTGRVLVNNLDLPIPPGDRL
jgi:type I restriction enzyme S subunit